MQHSQCTLPTLPQLGTNASDIAATKRQCYAYKYALYTEVGIACCDCRMSLIQIGQEVSDDMVHHLASAAQVDWLADRPAEVPPALQGDC